MFPAGNSYYEPPDDKMFTVLCDNPGCLNPHISWEDGEKDGFGNWVCGQCQIDGYQSPEAIIFNCDLDDDEIALRTIEVPYTDFFEAAGYACPICGKDGEWTEIYDRSTVNSLKDRPHHECTCAQCKEMFFVYME